MHAGLLLAWLPAAAALVGNGLQSLPPLAVPGEQSADPREGGARNPLECQPLAADDPRMIAMQAYLAKERRGVPLAPRKH